MIITLMTFYLKKRNQPIQGDKIEQLGKNKKQHSWLHNNKKKGPKNTKGHWNYGHLACRVKTKTRGNFFAFQVTVNSLRTSNNPSFYIISPAVVYQMKRFIRRLQEKQNKIQWEKFYLKFSARRQALVFESSPPMTTSPSKSSFFAVSWACLNWKVRIRDENS